MQKPSIAFALLTLIATFLLSGCETVSYVFRPPASEQGRMCVTQCAATKEACHGNEIQKAQREKASCERTANTMLHACLSRAKNKDQEKDCEKSRNHCWSHEDTSRCENDYRNCFMICGGVVEKHIEK